MDIQTSQQLFATRWGLAQRFQRLGLKPPVLLQENLYFAFRLFQLLAASRGQLDPFLKELEGLLERHLTLFEFLDDFFQALEALFKLWQYARSFAYCNPHPPQEWRKEM
jgi:hypothetical protein